MGISAEQARFERVVSKRQGSDIGDSQGDSHRHRQRKLGDDQQSEGPTASDRSRSDGHHRHAHQEGEHGEWAGQREERVGYHLL
ncbi:hypothetical protein D3C81_1602670 [compost metagenome]